MPTPPPNKRNNSNSSMKSSGGSANMAAAVHSAKAKPASKTAGNGNGNGNTHSNGVSKQQKAQMHRRSRSGCYTCRLRRKKCDEGTPHCTACKHLGLICEYKRPMWWSNNDARRKQKEDIKVIIKSKKLSEKSTTNIQTSTGSPPGLSHSLPTSATFTDPMDRNRSASIDSHFSSAFNFNSQPTHPEFGHFTPQMHPDFMFGGYSPYEIDVKTERQMFVNDVPTLRESHVSTFSTYQTPPPPGTVLSSNAYNGGEWTEQIHHERRESLSEEALNVNFFDFAHGPSRDSRHIKVELDENDQRLLDHFIQSVLPTVFPILESNQHGSVGSDLILPALQSNSIYRHCCLSIAAQHIKSLPHGASEEIDSDIMRHRYSTIWSLCEALKTDENHQQILEATLALIFFQCVVGRHDDTLLDIPWHQHFQAAISLVQKLDFPRIVSDPAGRFNQTPFNMTLTAWIDILGASMQGLSPTFAHTYREKHLSQLNPNLGLRELMGCEDRVMYLISEIACLESLKKDGMDDFTLCQHVSTLGEQISLTEMNDSGPKMPYSGNGTLSPKQLAKNITSAFRVAARIYLCSLVPGFSPKQPSAMALVEKLTNVLQFVPSGPTGNDRGLVWVYLIGGSISIPGSSFRTFFEDRIVQLGNDAECGSFGRMVKLLRETWAHNDQSVSSTADANGEIAQPHIHWRDVMQMNGWDFLLI